MLRERELSRRQNSSLPQWKSSTTKGPSLTPRRSCVASDDRKKSDGSERALVGVANTAPTVARLASLSLLISAILMPALLSSSTDWFTPPGGITGQAKKKKRYARCSGRGGTCDCVLEAEKWERLKENIRTQRREKNTAVHGVFHPLRPAEKNSICA